MTGNNKDTTMATVAAEEGTPLLHPKIKQLEENDVSASSAGTSTVSATIFNFTNSIVGAGCIALGSAMAESGGLVSIAAISFFAILSKHSFDLVISLSREAAAADPASKITAASYESLGEHAYGPGGRTLVAACKLIYSYGSLVAYIKIVKDNFASAVVQLCTMVMSPTSPHIAWSIRHDDFVTVLVSLAVIFPICLLRNMSALERCSIAKVAIVFFMLFAMIYLWATSDYAEVSMDPPISAYERWFEVRPGFAKSLGSFVFTFVAQHTINLTYGSLKPSLQTMRNWQVVSTYSTVLSAIISMSVGLVSYATFWTDASSDLFSLYPKSSVPVALAKLFLSVMMMFTYPMTFLTCRELCIPIAPEKGNNNGKAWWLLGQQSDQLILPLHVALTFLIWGSTTILAILAPSLADVLNLVGSATGTLIAFVLPAMFSYRMRGYTHLAATLVLVGGSIGILGTYLSLLKLMGSTDYQ